MSGGASVLPAWIRAVPGGCELRLKVVPGASREQVAGPLGDRLKVRVAAPPEGGKANRAVCGLIAALTGARAEVAAGHGSPEKTVRIAADPAAVAARLQAGGTRP
jgi:uncharacterized protein (TIGR00251 family)